MSMTKQEYLDSLQAKVNKVLSPKAPSVQRRKKIVTGILVAGTLISVGVGVIGTSGEKSRAYSTYIEVASGSRDALAPYEHLDYKDIFELWNTHDIGNDVNVLLSGGKIYARNGMTILPTSDGKDTKIIKATGDEKTLGGKVSSINVVNDKIYYRDDDGRNIQAYDLATDQTTLIYDGNIGEMFVANGLVYCIDFDSNSSLISLDFHGQARTTIVESPVASFAVCGDTIVYLDTNQRLYRLGLKSTSPMQIVDNIERFFLNGRIYAESKNTIFSFSPLGNSSSKLYESDDDSLRLISVADGTVLYQETGELKCLVSGESSTLSTSPSKLYSSLTLNEEGNLYVITYSSNEDGELQQGVLELAMGKKREDTNYAQ